MAEVVLGVGTTHTPMASMPPKYWPEHAYNDRYRSDLMLPPDGTAHTYAQALERADPRWAKLATPDNFQRQYDAMQVALQAQKQAIADACPDIAVVIGDDQYELLFEDNMPPFLVYWGESMKLIPYERLLSAVTQTPSEAGRAAAWGYGDVEMDIPVPSDLGFHVVEQLVAAEFDVAHSRYLRDEYGGTITMRYPTADGRNLADERHCPPRPCGMPHSCSFVVRRLFENDPIPTLPVFVNIYPPTTPTPNRCYDFGRALRRAIDSWDSDKTVAIFTSGGLSHFVVDEELDRMVLKALDDKDERTLRNIPQHRLHSAASEIRGWIALGGAVEDLDHELIDYVPVYRTPAGTGGGWAFSLWRH